MATIRMFVRNRESVPLISFLTPKAKCLQARSKDVRENLPATPGLPHVPALDGLRALAVLCVLIYHANALWMPGGFLGVDVFFVISGFLITSLLLSEWSAHGHVNLKSFWLRRARRLLPALFLVLLAVVAYAAAFLPAEVAGLRGDVLSTAAYVNNWYQLADHKSYFETVGRPSLLKHLWSLAVEEQFYVVWPILFSLLMWRRLKRLAVWIVLTGAIASAWWMAALYQPDMDPSRVYYGTDTRAGELLIGAALAFLLKPGRTINRIKGCFLDTVGLSALCALAACVLLISEFQPLLYRGGFIFIALASACLIAVAVHPGANFIPRALAWKPLLWIGLRSYGIYLWHFPIFMVTRPQLDIPLDGVPLLLIRFALTTLAAALSYRFVESPIRQGAPGRAWKEWLEAQGDKHRSLGYRWAGAALSTGIVVFTLGAFLLNAQPPLPPEYLSVVPTPAALIPEPLPLQQPAQTPTNEPPSVPEAITAIGDSVLLGVGDELKRSLARDIIIDADLGRQPCKTPAIIQRLQSAHKINPIVILHIGDNGIFTARVFDKIMAELTNAHHVVVVNVKVPRNWETPNNAMLADAVKRYPNTTLMDWHDASKDRPELFWKDGLHLRPEGAKFYAALLAKTLASEEHCNSIPVQERRLALTD